MNGIIACLICSALVIVVGVYGMNTAKTESEYSFWVSLTLIGFTPGACLIVGFSVFVLFLMAMFELEKWNLRRFKRKSALNPSSNGKQKG